MNPTESNPPLVVLLGATAVGKTELSLEICRRTNAEIISADSRQIYRGMDIGTAKPSLEEQEQARHHLIDIRDPDEPITLSEYQRLAYDVIDSSHARGKVPLLVGGTVLYVRAVVEGLRIPEVPPNPELRAELEQLLTEKGVDALYEMLRTKDPASAAVVDANNPRRLIRALEVFIETGKSRVELEGQDPPDYSILLLGLERSRASLHERIDRRVDWMMQNGLVEETKTLLAAGYDSNLPAMSSLGYREIGAYLHGKMSYAEAVQQIKIETHRYLRHQYTWLRKMDGIVWVDMDGEDGLQIALSTVDEFLARSGWPGGNDEARG